MQIALLTGASPKSCTVGPTVRLHSGKWRLVTNGLVDSKISFVLDATTPISHDKDVELLIDGPCIISTLFKDRGTEQFISVYAELVI